METVRIQRTETGDEGTFGFIIINSVKLYTVELPWRDNHPMYSCVPAGEYQCEFQGMKYHVLDVPGRTGIMIHAANLGGDVTKGWKSDLEGCIGLGMRFGALSIPGGKYQRGVLNSQLAISLFEKELNHQRFVLKIS